jgi:hypothetical protein
MTNATPTTANRTLRRLPNATYRSREYLTEAEVDLEPTVRRARAGAASAVARRAERADDGRNEPMGWELRTKSSRCVRLMRIQAERNRRPRRGSRAIDWQ